MTTIIDGTTGVDKVVDGSIAIADLASEVYQTGTWVPRIEGSTTAGVGTYTTQTGKYTKLGNVVFFQCYVYWTAHTGTGWLRVYGLPYTALATTSAYGTATVEASAVALTAGNIPSAIVIPNNSFVAINQTPVGGGTTVSAPIDAAGELIISGHYFTS